MADPWIQESDELDDGQGPGAGLFGRIKAALDPAEFLLWADRPRGPAPLRVPVVPAVFISVLAGLSGFSLAALFGMVGEAWLKPWRLALALGLGPCVLGGMIVLHLISVLVRRWLRRRRLARMIYAVTDRRAIVARIASAGGEMEWRWLRPGEILDTRIFENPDGSGDLYFIGQESDDWLSLGFFEIRQVSFVEALVREALLDFEGDWWKLGPAGAC